MSASRLPLTFLLCVAVSLCFAQARVSGAELPGPSSPIAVTVETDFQLPERYVLPRTVDLSHWFPPAGDQHRQYSCTAWALGYGLMSYRLNKLAGRVVPDTLNAAQTFSPAYLFNLMKFIDGSDCTSGVDFESLAEMVPLSGCAWWQELPYDTAVTACRKRLLPQVMLDAMRNHTPPMVQLDKYNIAQWKYHLAEERPIVATIVIDSSFVHSGAATNGERPFVWDLPHWGKNDGGHAVVCTGYDGDSTFTFLNSFGERWGEHGYFKATWEVLLYKCYGAYIMSNDTAATWAADPGRAADKDVLTGSGVRESFKPGEFQEINGLKVKFTDLRNGGEQAVVQFFDACSDSLLQTLVVPRDQPHTFYHEGRSITYAWRKRSGPASWFDHSVPFTVAEVPAQEDAFVKRRNEQLKALRRADR